MLSNEIFLIVLDVGKKLIGLEKKTSSDNDLLQSSKGVERSGSVMLTEIILSFKNSFSSYCL